MADEKQQNTPSNAPKASEGGGSTDAQAGAKVGLSEGAVHGLRDAAGVNQSPGHTANLASWEQSEGGKEFLKGEADRQKAQKDEAEALEKATNDKGLDEDSEKYLKALNKK